MTMHAGIVTIYAFSVLATVVAVGWAYRYGRGADRRLFLLAGGGALAWSLAVSAQLVVRGETLIRLFQLTWILRWLSVFGWLLFVMEYTGRQWRRPAVIGPVIGTFLIAAVSIGTTHQTGLVFSSFTLVSDPVTHVSFTREIGYYLLGIPAFTVIGYVVLALGRVTLRTRRDNRRQAAALALGLLVPGVIGLAQTANLLPQQWIRYAAAGNALQMVLVAYGVFGGSLFRIRPITRTETIEAIDDPILVVGTDGRVSDFNRAATAAFPDVAAGESVVTVAPALIADESAGVPGGLVEELTTTIGGERRRLVVTADPVDRGTVVVCRDVTDVEAYAAELERQTEQLDRFASVVSHDLRNPLTIAQGRAEMAARASEEPAVLDNLEQVQSAHDRMAQLIEDTLTLAREGSVVDDPEYVSLEKIARRSWRYVESDGQLETDDASGYSIEADPGRLQSAFENLYRNAREHAGPEPTVRVGITADGFYVADDGPGIPEEDRAEIFTEGFTTNDEGTGFGLAIVESVATAHGGEVRVTESRTGGARFEFSGFRVSGAPEATCDQQSPAVGN